MSSELVVGEEEFHPPGDRPIRTPKEDSHEGGHNYDGYGRVDHFVFAGPIHAMQLGEEFACLMFNG
jgi:hypothetical protein